MKLLRNIYEIINSRFVLILWISLATYLFYNTFIYYLYGRQFYHLRKILGLGLCVSRGTATVLNLCSALVLLPLCKKLNQLLFRLLSHWCPGLFFYWLERAKSFHMTVAVTLLLFAVIHSISHFINLWNFSRGYDDERLAINFASYRNENPLLLLLSQAGLTGVLMLLIILCMGLTSLRLVRRKFYNAFWYTHQLYMLFLVLLIVHPLSGVLKEEVLEENRFVLNLKEEQNTNVTIISVKERFVSIQSTTWLWMAFPLTSFILDTLWRISSRNLAKVNILQVTYLPGRVINLSVSCPRAGFAPRMGQYVLLHCHDLSLLEWHPFTIVKVPTSSQHYFVLWIRVKGDWTEALEKLLLERGPKKLSMFVDGPFSSPMEEASAGHIAICVAAGIGITPFVSLLHHMYTNPRSHTPGRIHLLWIVRHEEEITWLAELASKTLAVLREANRPDRLHIQLYITNTKSKVAIDDTQKEMIAIVNGKGAVENITKRYAEDEKAKLLTLDSGRSNSDNCKDKTANTNGYCVAKEYPVLACRVKMGRPHWDRVFGYWVHLYPKDHLNLYCCGPKKLVKLLRSKCKVVTTTTKTKFTFVHEGFS
ncbi:hypothetical protein evm_000557 [Chilo suppressalis]|nr:hypothetical protein evm_000557 [Chilo suppressalis]